MSTGPDGPTRPARRRARSATELRPRGPASRRTEGLHYRVEFLASSAGTEQELDGVVIKRRTTAGRKIGEVLRLGETLLLITTDMVHGEDAGYHTCTLEIVTTPTEDDDELGWAYRIEAFTLLIAEIEGVARRRGGAGGSLTSELLGTGSPYLVLICEPDHVIAMSSPNSNVVVISTDRQATLGFAVADVLDPAFHLAGGMDTPLWYDGAAEVWAAAQWPGEPAMQLAYAFVESGIQNCVALMRQDQAVVDAVWTTTVALRLLAKARTACLSVVHLSDDDEDKKNLLALYQEADQEVTRALTAAARAVAVLMASPGWKNGWKPLPRTPLIALLDQLPDADAAEVLARLENFLADDLDPVVQWAKNHVLRGYRLGGHAIDQPTISGGPGFLLEYRGVHPDSAKDKFYYTPGEAGIYQAPVPPRVRRERAEAAARRRQRRKSI